MYEVKILLQWSAYFFVICVCCFLGIEFLIIFEPFFKPMLVTQKDIYGTYVIDRNKYPGKQADWQYQNFKFEITDDNKMIFQFRIYDDYWKQEIVDVSYSPGYFDFSKNEYCNQRIRIHSDKNNHHIIRNNPTLYRKNFNRFYYVFESEKFGNVFFKKGKWEKSSRFSMEGINL